MANVHAIDFEPSFFRERKIYEEDEKQQSTNRNDLKTLCKSALHRMSEKWWMAKEEISEDKDNEIDFC